jgi:hypothetical protein
VHSLKESNAKGATAKHQYFSKELAELISTAAAL